MYSPPVEIITMTHIQFGCYIKMCIVLHTHLFLGGVGVRMTSSKH